MCDKGRSDIDIRVFLLAKAQIDHYLGNGKYHAHLSTISMLYALLVPRTAPQYVSGPIVGGVVNMERVPWAVIHMCIRLHQAPEHANNAT